MRRIVISGGSGFLGQALAARLVGRGDEVVIVSRGEGEQVEGTRTVVWDAESIGPWGSELDGADAIVHLTGRRVEVRGTKRNIDEHSTPTGIGPREMVTVCLAWEGAFRQASAVVERTVLLRMGIGLGGRSDPATAKLTQLVRFGLGGRVGSGRQWVSWVGLDDLLAAMILAIDDDTMTWHVPRDVAQPGDERGDDVDLPAPARATDRTAQPCPTGTNRRADTREQREPGAGRSTGRPHPPSRSRLHLRAARLRAGRTKGARSLRAGLS